MYDKWVLILIFVLTETEAIQRPEDERGRGVRVRHETRNASLESHRPCDTDQLAYRLQRLEAQTVEKSEMLSSELRENSRRINALEWQTGEIRTALEEFRNELRRFAENGERSLRASGSSDMLDFKIDNLAKGFQLVTTALRSLRTDIAEIKENISAISDSTNFHVDQSHSQPSHRHISRSLPKNCKEVQERGHNDSGIYNIQPELAPESFMVLCDLRTSGGGWTYIHNRHDGAQDFYLNWSSYKLGFGNLGGEFWLGLEYLHQLTGYEVNELLVELEDLEGRRVHAHYGAFSVGSELEGYALKVLAGYQGDAGDSLTYHAGSKFSTKDMDQDDWPEGSCAQVHTGAWWYRSCDNSNLNGKYLKGEVPEVFLYQGMYWRDFHGAQYSLSRARMMVRPRIERPTTVS